MRWLALAVVLLLAGCSDGDPSSKDDGEDATSVLGGLQGIVVSEAIVPIAGANVTLVPGNATTTTSADGGFAFTGLEPGSYTLTVTLTGYVPVTQPAQTGETLVKVILVPDTSSQRYVQVQGYEGFIETSANLGGARTSNGDTPNYTFEGRLPDFIQVEMVWDSSQALGDEMDLTLVANDGGATVPDVAHAEGQSPLMANLNATAIAAAGFGPGVDLDLFIFVGQSDVAQGRGAGAAVNQRFQVFTLFFFGFEPPADYIFVRDGLPQVPS